MDRLVGTESAVGVGEGAAGPVLPSAPTTGAGVESGVDCEGEGRDCTTFNKSLLVLTAMDWIMGTSWARFGKMARINRGAKGTIISCAKVRNSESHRRAVDCWISSSAKSINIVH